MRFKVLKYRLRTSNERIETKICQSRSRGLKATKETSVPRKKVGHRLFYTYLLKSFTISLIKNHYSLYQNSKRHF